MADADLRSELSQPGWVGGGFGGRGNLTVAKDSPLRTFRRLEPPARVVDEAEMGNSAGFVPRTDPRQEYVCVCVYIW